MEEDDSMAEEIMRLKELLVLMTGSTHNRCIQFDDEDIDAESLKQWLHQLNQEIKMAEVSIDYKVKGHVYIVPQFLKLLHHCLLSHQWTDALRVLEALAYEPKGTSKTIWKAGMEVLYSNPEENDGFISQLFRQLKLLKELHADDIVLEYMMYLLSQGRVAEAAAVVKQKEQKKGQGSRKEKTVNLPDHPPAVYKAYKGLVWYVEWLLLKHQTLQDTNQTDESWQMSSQADYQQLKISQHAHQAIMLMEGVCEIPGVWDTFIVKLVQLKKEYESVESAHSVLVRYRELNPDNPNCHRYLYEFYVEHGAADEEKIGVLKDLVGRDPSNPLVLDLCRLLDGSRPVGRYLFEMLDYCNWQDKLKPWRKFRKHLVNIKLSKQPDHIQVVQECWYERLSWWPVYHFRSGDVCSDKSDKALMFEKAACCAVLMGTGNDYTKKCMEVLDEKHQQRLVRLQESLHDT